MYQWRTGRSCVFKNFVRLIVVTEYRKKFYLLNDNKDQKIVYLNMLTDGC